MSDLISRSDLLNAFNNKKLEIIYKIPVDIDTMRTVNYAINSHKNLVIDIIKNQPKAYDVDKVVKELDKASDYYECEEQGREHVQMVDLTDAIEIVKDGGVVDDMCEWKLEDEEANLYVTECQQRQLIFEGTPKENNYTYCPYCGKKIKEGGVDEQSI